MVTGTLPVIGWKECQAEAYGTRGSTGIMWLALDITNVSTRTFFPIKFSCGADSSWFLDVIPSWSWVRLIIHAPFTCRLEKAWRYVYQQAHLDRHMGQLSNLIGEERNYLVRKEGTGDELASCYKNICFNIRLLTSSEPSEAYHILQTDSGWVTVCGFIFNCSWVCIVG